jgi:SHAQKYF class myb-like DNA-binding protein
LIQHLLNRTFLTRSSSSHNGKSRTGWIRAKQGWMFGCFFPFFSFLFFSLRDFVSWKRSPSLPFLPTFFPLCRFCCRSSFFSCFSFSQFFLLHLTLLRSYSSSSQPSSSGLSLYFLFFACKSSPPPNAFILTRLDRFVPGLFPSSPTSLLFLFFFFSASLTSSPCSSPHKRLETPTPLTPPQVDSGGEEMDREGERRKTLSSSSSSSALISSISPPSPSSSSSSTSRFRWSAEFHQTFLKSLKKLGWENATPTTILFLMKDKGVSVTRPQISSHLQVRLTQ